MNNQSERLTVQLEAQQAEHVLHGGDDGEWIKHDGGTCPVDGETMVSVQFMNGDIQAGYIPAKLRYWSSLGMSSDISSYRVSRKLPSLFDLRATHAQIIDIEKHMFELQQQRVHLACKRDQLVEALRAEGFEVAR